MKKKKKIVEIDIILSKYNQKLDNLCNLCSKQNFWIFLKENNFAFLLFFSTFIFVVPQQHNCEYSEILN